MTTTEVRAFETNRYHQDAVRLRLYDDDGKVAGLTIRPVTDYRNMLESLVMQST
jgi:predicted HD phosphohydrolase